VLALPRDAVFAGHVLRGLPSVTGSPAGGTAIRATLRLSSPQSEAAPG
jgi:hypothetical protein